MHLFRKCFGNSVTEFSFPSNLNFNLLSRIQGAYLIFTFISYFPGTFVVGLFYFILLISLFCTKFHVSLNFTRTFVFNNLTTFFEETISFAWLKAIHKMFILNLRKVSLIKYIRHKIIQMECGKPFYKKIACLHDVIFISQHFDWVLCIILECDWINNF